MFGMDVQAYLQIDTIVLEFPISLASWNGGAQVSTLGPPICKNWRFSSLKSFRGGI